MTLLEDFDNIIDGGLQENTLFLLRGIPASGKTLFALSLARELASKGRTVVYLTTELPPADLRENVRHGLGWDITELERSGRLVLLDGYSWRLGKSAREVGQIDLTNLSEASAALNRIVQELQRTVKPGEHPMFFILDTVSSLLMYNDLTTVVKFMQVQVARFRDAHVSALLVLEAGMDDEPLLQKMSFFVDGVFETKLLEAHGEIHRYFRVQALRRAMHYTGWLHFEAASYGFQFTTPLRGQMWRMEEAREHAFERT